MRALGELVGVIAAGVVAFFSGIAFALGFILLWGCGIASGLCIAVGIFAGVVFWITGKTHDLQIALTYFGYAVVPFVLTFIAGYYRSKFAHRGA